VRRVKGFHGRPGAVERACGEACIGAALGAVTVQDVEVQRCGVGADGTGRLHVAEAGISAHRRAQDAEAEQWFDGSKLRRGQAVFRVAISEDANVMPAPRLFGRKIQHMPE